MAKRERESDGLTPVLVVGGGALLLWWLSRPGPAGASWWDELLGPSAAPVPRPVPKPAAGAVSPLGILGLAAGLVKPITGLVSSLTGTTAPPVPTIPGEAGAGLPDIGAPPGAEEILGELTGPTTAIVPELVAPLSEIAPADLATYTTLLESGYPPQEAALSAFGSGAEAAINTLATSGLSVVAAADMPVYTTLVAQGFPPAEAALSAYGTGAAAANVSASVLGIEGAEAAIAGYGLQGVVAADLAGMTGSELGAAVASGAIPATSPTGAAVAAGALPLGVALAALAVPLIAFAIGMMVTAAQKKQEAGAQQLASSNIIQQVQAVQEPRQLAPITDWIRQQYGEQWRYHEQLQEMIASSLFPPGSVPQFYGFWGDRFPGLARALEVAFPGTQGGMVNVWPADPAWQPFVTLHVLGDLLAAHVTATNRLPTRDEYLGWIHRAYRYYEAPVEIAMDTGR